MGMMSTHIVSPDQRGTTDLCTPTDEGDQQIIDACGTTGLTVLGWIHVSFSLLLLQTFYKILS
jgi:hypothetical protein